LRHHESSWEKKNKDLTDSCDQLLGADGTSVYPEIPAALKNLHQASYWLTKSIDCAELSKKEIEDSYIKRSRFFTAGASKILKRI
jgi:hypothetical protein